MASIENDGPTVSRATQPLLVLREILQTARHSDDAERIRAALIDVVDGLITHAERQARAIEDLRSDVSYKQGIITKIGDGGHKAPTGKLAPVQSVDPNDNDELDR